MVVTFYQAVQQHVTQQGRAVDLVMYQNDLLRVDIEKAKVMLKDDKACYLIV